MTNMRYGSKKVQCIAFEHCNGAMFKAHLEREATPVISSRPSRRKSRRPDAAFGSFYFYSLLFQSSHLSLDFFYNVKFWIDLGGDALNVLANELSASR